MKNNNNCKFIPLSINRQILIASASVTGEKNTIHGFTEADITIPRLHMKEHYEKTGEKLSLTAYIVACLAKVIREYPQMNSFIKGRKLVILNDITVSVLIEREINGEKIPEPIGIKEAQTKTFYQIQNEIREAKKIKNDKLGSLEDQAWVRFIPNFLLKTFVRFADKNIIMAKRYGKIAVTAIGMFSKEPVWFLPHGSSTVLITVGGISNKVVEIDGKFVSREHLCLTASFDHNIIDGAPAARFMTRFIEEIKSGKLMQKETI
jgi:pyruvate/2-oxoglutarate dehydrogenase complex dihydrolipoamide acyltransferase (E2) component